MALHRPLLTGLLVLLAAPIDAAPRDAVDGVAEVIAARYFDAERGATIAAGLRAAAARGEFDAFDEPGELATTLGERLRPYDAHFSVRWSAAESAAAPATPAGTPRRRPPADPAGGVRRLEILAGDVGYLDLREFAHFRFGATGEPAREAIDAALRLLAGTDATIIDLRGNGGGSPAMVGYLVSAFTPPGADIYNVFHSREGTQSEAPREHHPAPRLDVPLFVLTSGRTGSAAEAFAYTLKNAGRATVVGERSGGAANPGGEFDAGNGYRVFVSTGSPVSPVTGTNWEGTGVLPDVPVPADEAREHAHRLALERIVAGDAATTEARWALDALRAGAAAAPLSGADRYAGRYGAWSVGLRGGRLAAWRERRPAWHLLALGHDLFAVIDEPRRRLRFVVAEGGAITAMEILDADGPTSRYARD